MEDGTITRNVFGISRKEAEEISFRASKGDYGIASILEAKLIGKKTGKKFDEYNESRPTSPQTAEVEKIRITTDLDDGSANDNSKTSIKKGMLHGKKYVLEVIQFKGDIEPDNERNIKWAYGYSKEPTEADSIGEVIIGSISQTGKKIKFKADNLDMCGREITFYAYIQEKNNGGQLPVFHHYRFHWFDRKAIETEVEERKSKPWLANQKNTSLCGMAAILYLLAKQNHDLYKKFVLGLHQTGYYKFDEYVVDVSKKSGHLLKMNPATNASYPEDYKSKMPYCDWISFSSIRDQENNVRDFDGEDDFSFDGATFPNEIETLMKGILGCSNVVDNANMVFNKGSMLWDGEGSSAREIAKMQQLYLDGYNIVMLVNTNMIEQKQVLFSKGGKNYIIQGKKAQKSGLFSTMEHWIVFEGVIGGTISWDEYDFKVFTWGEIKDVIVDPEIFSTNYYGYVYGK